MVTPANTSPTAVPTGAPAPSPAKARDLIGPSAKVVPINPIAAGVTLYRSVSHSSLPPSQDGNRPHPEYATPASARKMKSCILFWASPMPRNIAPPIADPILKTGLWPYMSQILPESKRQHAVANDPDDATHCNWPDGILERDRDSIKAPSGRYMRSGPALPDYLPQICTDVGDSNRASYTRSHLHQGGCHDQGHQCDRTRG